MSSNLFDLIILWSSGTDDQEYISLKNMLNNQFQTAFNICSFQTVTEALKHIQELDKTRLLIVITKLGTNNENSAQTLIETIRRREKHTFIILHSHTACSDPNIRWSFAALGVNMITTSMEQIQIVLHRLVPLGEKSPKPHFTCPHCSWSSFSFSQLYVHIPIYHTNEQELSAKCQLCNCNARNISVHLFEDHSPNGKQRSKAAPLYAFSLVVCQRKRDNRFLVVQESGSMGFWLPGGRVELGEQLDKAAERETLEEAGVKIRVTGVLKFEFSPRMDSNRLRVIFFAEPCNEDDCEPKTIPDYESYGAMWLTYEQTVQCGADGQLRGNEPLKWFKYITQNGLIHPLSILSKSEV